MGDENASTQSVLQAFNIMEVPTFLFFKNGKEVGRHVGSSRGDLIGKILQVRERGNSCCAGPVFAAALDGCRKDLLHTCCLTPC
jgi:thioredoxin-like negative regulator of GroEL